MVTSVPYQLRSFREELAENDQETVAVGDTPS